MMTHVHDKMKEAGYRADFFFSYYFHGLFTMKVTKKHTSASLPKCA